MKRKRMTRAQYAAHRAKLGLSGASVSAVAKALQTGRIEDYTDGTIDPVEADRMWGERTYYRYDRYQGERFQ